MSLLAFVIIGTGLFLYLVMKRPKHRKNVWEEKGASHELGRLLEILDSIERSSDPIGKTPHSLRGLISKIHKESHGRTALTEETLEKLYIRATPSMSKICLETFFGDAIYGAVICRAIIHKNQPPNIQEIHFLEEQAARYPNAETFLQELLGAEIDAVVDRLCHGDFSPSESEKFLGSLNTDQFAIGKRHLYEVYSGVFPFDFVPGEIRAFLRFTAVLTRVIGEKLSLECAARAIAREPLSVNIIGFCMDADEALMQEIRDVVKTILPYLNEEVLDLIQEIHTEIHPNTLAQLQLEAGAEKLKRKNAGRAQK